MDVISDLSTETKQETDKKLQQIQNYINEIKENSTIKLTWLNKYDEEIENILKETGMDQHPELTLQCMIQQQKDKLLLANQITSTIDMCVVTGNDFESVIQNKRKIIEELINDLPITEIMKNCEMTKKACDDVLRTDILSGASELKLRIPVLLEDIDSVISGLMGDIQKCLETSEEVFENYILNYTNRFRKCLEALAQ